MAVASPTATCWVTSWPARKIPSAPRERSRGAGASCARQALCGGISAARRIMHAPERPMGLTRAARDAPSMSRGSALAATLPEPCAPPSRRRAFPLPARSAPAARFAAYSAASTPDVSRETSVLAPRLAHDSGSSSMPPLTVEASVGSRSAVTFPPPDVRQNRRFGSPSSDFAVTGHRRHGFGRQNPRSGFSSAENRELRLPKRRFCRTSGGGNGAAGATGRESALVQRRSMEEGDPSMGGGRALCAK